MQSSSYFTAGLENYENYNIIGNVLVSKQSKLVSIFIMEHSNYIATLDSDYLMRIWSILNGK